MQRFLKKIKIIFISLSLSGILVNSSLAQLNNQPFFESSRIDTTKSGDLMVGIRALAFNKDNEYFNKIVDGYTLFGYQLNPYLSYYPSEKVMLELGVFVWKDFGNSKYTQIAPTFTIGFKMDSLTFYFGTIRGSLNHRLIEPLYNFENVIFRRLENGIQSIYHKKNIYIDAWVDWEVMQYYYDSRQEELWGGISTIVTPVDNENLMVTIPVQAVAKHIGGQIDTNQTPLTTILNGALGLGVYYKRPGARFLKGVNFDNYWVFYKDFSFTKLRPFQEGSGAYLNITFLTKLGDLMVSYWRGNNYIGIKGGDLYQSVSTSMWAPGYIEPQRELLIFRLMKNVFISKSLILSTRFEPFYDLNNKVFNFSAGLYLNFRDEFFITKVKKAKYR